MLFQSSVQHFAMAPNNLTDAPAWAIDFMKKVPTTWDEVKFIDGYPGKYVILARRSGDKWFVVGALYSDDDQLNGSVKTIKQNKKQQLSVTIPCNGALVIEN